MNTDSAMRPTITDGDMEDYSNMTREELVAEIVRLKGYYSLLVRAINRYATNLRKELDNINKEIGNDIRGTTGE